MIYITFFIGILIDKRDDKKDKVLETSTRYKYRYDTSTGNRYKYKIQGTSTEY